MSDSLLRDYYAYNDQASRTFIEILAGADAPPADAIRLFSHILNAHAVWLARIAGVDAPFGIWDLHAPDALAAIHASNQDSTAPLLVPDRLPVVINYRNSNGTRFRNTVQEILLHVANHSTYHRGQVAAVLRKAGFDPPVTDYVFFNRTPLD